MTRKISWTTKSGKQASVTITLETNKEINADGDKITVKCCDKHIVGEVEGVGVVGYDICTATPAAASLGGAAMCGKLIILPTEYAQIKAAIVEIEANPEWQAKLVRQAASRKAEIEYDAHCRMMQRAMAI